MKWGARESLNSRASVNSGKETWGWPRRPDFCGASQLLTSPLCRPGRARRGFGDRTREQPGRLGRREGQGRRKESGPPLPPPRPSGCPPRLPRARRSRRPSSRRSRRWRRRGRSRLQEPLETESPAAAGQRTGGRVSTEGQAQVVSRIPIHFPHLKPENSGPHKVFLVPGEISN